jgi:hypothetical protein
LFLVKDLAPFFGGEEKDWIKALLKDQKPITFAVYVYFKVSITYTFYGEFP